ncbi:toprim domain-containing protein [Desulfomonile tiedjei]|uniref:DNA primase n=1 Tax=Desulfomonile tiedjei (strain ATCC 49306 / DSM 6799 / DCB-1) TaxID=706587 RepID=I4C602_DESTA|nr:toprim domain-containing protein [Desulfomonile tiedjei]AFM24993.1 DNA primase [Desulfomonile tiedjei DSM 6799]
MSKSKELIDYLDEVSMPELLEKLGKQIRGNKTAAFDREETEPSVHVNQHFCYDYGPGEWIGKLDVIQKILKCSRSEALKKFTALFSLPEFNMDPAKMEIVAKQERISKEYQFLFRSSLKNADIAHKYFAGRGIPESVIKGKVGYITSGSDPSNWDESRNAGLINKNDTFFLFKGRIIIPIVRGDQIVSILGRTTNPDVNPKYMCTAATDPEMPQTLYGLDDVRNESEVYLVEGVTDKWTLEAHGYPAVSTFGTQGLTPARIKELKKTKAEKIIMAMDTDRQSGSGQAAALDKGKALFAAGFDVEIITLPLLDDEDKVDINSFFQRNL